MRIHLDYTRSIRCTLGRHDKGDADHGCPGGFRPLLRNCARFCLCECHDRPTGIVEFPATLTEAQVADLKRRFIEVQKTQPIRIVVRPAPTAWTDRRKLMQDTYGAASEMAERPTEFRLHDETDVALLSEQIKQQQRQRDHLQFGFGREERDWVAAPDPVTALFGIPILIDEDVPPHHLRIVRPSGTTDINVTWNPTDDRSE